MAVQNEEVLYQDRFDPALTREIAEAIYEREGAEFSCATKDFLLYYAKDAPFSGTDDRGGKNRLQGDRQL